MPFTLVTFHAHPDDEALITGGTMAKAAERGHRVVLVVATRGEHSALGLDALDDGEELWERRVAETHRSAEILGVSRVEFLGYRDSGMMGAPENHDAGSFWAADVDEAGARLAALLAEENADALTVYDERGGYDHPDHIQVHRVGLSAARRAGTSVVYEATMNRDHLRRLVKEGAARGELPDAPDAPDPDEFDVGVDESRITTTVDVTAFLDRKRAAMTAHASQIGESSFFLQMPIDTFRDAFGTEWFIRRGDPPGSAEAGLFEALD